ncbi:MAG: right-handed parallel beta-helix repeat-containing protein [Chitinispirillales bacterium]|jgi:hypothetical protein|nr:right-handed parallel beta-helix repeat-containing protein [Chitinispirillales bacterium]
MLAKRIGIIAALAALTVVVGAANAQKMKAPGTDITVCKPVAGGDDCNFTTIQAAVNAAKAGQVIEILDESEYAEQVTIDGRTQRDNPNKPGTAKDDDPWSPWSGVTGGNDGITIRYVPSSNAAFSLHKRPTIKWRDTQNTSPKNATEALTGGELTGSSGNFETCGALRVIRAKGVTIEGITVDGGGRAPFGATGVWGGQWPLYHGNAAITLAVAGQVTIRDCDLKNAYYGVNIKDRNTGGVFAKPNPNDNDTKDIVPISGFGNVGGHLIEYNRIDSNRVGIFTESAYDIASTVRYNLFYHNLATLPTAPAVSGLPGSESEKSAGAIRFKDVPVTPLAIYNNTFYGNTGTLFGDWQTGATGLVFNNIFSKATPSGNPNQASMDASFPFRMNNCVFSADLADRNGLRAQYQGNYNCNNNPNAPGGIFIATVQLGKFSAAQTTSVMINTCGNNGEAQQPQNQPIVMPGALFTGVQQQTVSIAGAELRWLQTEGGDVYTQDNPPRGPVKLDTLFKSLNPASADFLVPNWTLAPIKDYVQNKGWALAGMKTSDGKAADLGAHPSSGGRQTTVARILPQNVVLLNGNGTSGTANFMLKVEKGTFNNAKVKMLRWVAPIPDNTDSDGGNCKVVPSTSIHNIAAAVGTAVRTGSNSFQFNTGTTVSTADTVGFFEIIVEGTDANGNAVTSDVGFLPYRALEYGLKITVNGKDANVTVTAGSTCTLKVVPVNLKTGAPWAGTLTQVEYQLLSDPTAFMFNATAGNPGNPAINTPLVAHPASPAFTGPGGATYYIYFTRAGDETITGAGRYIENNKNVTFFGTLGLTVLPGAPEKITFISPIPKSQLGPNDPAPIINRGADYPVRVEVQDRFGNAAPLPSGGTVSIRSENTNVGTVRSPTMTAVAGEPGVYTVIANVAPTAATREEFDLTATLSINNATDVGRLRVGRTIDRLEVFYSDTGSAKDWKEYFDPSVILTVNMGDWYKVTVKAVAPDSVLASKNGTVVVTPSNPNIMLKANPSDPAGSTQFALVNGVATFYLGAEGLTVDIKDACIDVDFWSGGSVDMSVMGGGRCDINIIKPSTMVDSAVVRGDGHGRPVDVRLYFQAAVVGTPDSVSIMWPQGNGVVSVAKGTALAVDAADSKVLRASFAPGALVKGYTGLSSSTSDGRGVVRLHGYMNVPMDSSFMSIDRIGPIVARQMDAADRRNPRVVDNASPGTAPDVIHMQVSEPVSADWATALVGPSVLYYMKAGDPGLDTNEATGGTALTVTAARTYTDFGAGINNAYELTVGAIAGGLAEGDWIRFNGATALADARGNGVHPNNRWVKLDLKSVAPEILDTAWYTSNPSTGFVNYAYIKWNKPVNVASWFAGGYLVFSGVLSFKDSIALGADPSEYISVDPGDPNTIVIDLSKAYPHSSGTVKTSGDLQVSIGFNPAESEWEPIRNRRVVDMAKPVIADTVWLRLGALKDDGVGRHPDTLVVIYSEQIPRDLLDKRTPVVFSTSNGAGGARDECKPVDLQYVRGNLNSRTGYYEVWYTTDTVACGYNATTEVRINDLEGIADERGFVQDVADNALRPLKVKRNIRWTLTIKNNPFRGGAGSATAVVKPGLSGTEKDVKIESRILVFDNIGSLAVDTTVVVENANELTWEWSGHNKKGRLVGTGIYLMRVKSEVTIDGVTSKSDRGYSSNMKKQIGVVRGKK